MKICTKCKQPGKFNKCKDTKDGLQRWCCVCLKEAKQKPEYKAKQSIYSKKYNKTPERQAYTKKHTRAYGLKRFYNLTLDNYTLMLHNQSFCCAICNTHQSKLKKSLAVDHDHKTGAVRKLLCGPCNKGIGLFKDSEQLLKRAAAYIYEMEPKCL